MGRRGNLCVTRRLAVLLAVAVLVAGCNKKSRRATDADSPAPTPAPAGPNIPGAPVLPGPAVAQTRPAVKVMAEVADVIGTIRDKASLEAARPRLKALEPRFQEHQPVLVAAAYLSGQAIPGLNPKMAAELAKQVEHDPEFQPYLPEARAVLADPAFLPTQRRYVAALRQAAAVPGGAEAVLPLQVQTKPGP